MLFLSKSKYCCAVQCPKMLWLKENMPEEEIFTADPAILEQGNKVGDLAMGIFGDFTEIPYGKPGTMLEPTRKEIEKGTSVICEASFSYNGNFCSVDILKNKGNRHFEIYEVKSSTKLAEIYLHDIAYQVYILQSLGYIIDRACLIHIDNKYVRHGELEINKFFTTEDVTEIVMGMQKDVGERLEFLESYMQSETEPDDGIGIKCTQPYECGFWNYCTKDLEKPNIFDVKRRLSAKKKFEIFNDGKISFRDLLDDERLNECQTRQIDSELTGRETINRDRIKEFLDTLRYPMYFIDFETIMPAIPPYDDAKPYQQLPFQYSLHILYEDGTLEHREFLGEAGKDPRRKLAEQLCSDIPADACSIAYNMKFEKARIKEMADIFPNLKEHLMNIHANMKDIMVPFENMDYYLPSMKGSYSIKLVLPSLYPGDPELDYTNLEGVHVGTEASQAFIDMETMSPDEVKEKRQQLLKYCGLDTYAMVKIFYKLSEIAEEKHKA